RGTSLKPVTPAAGTVKRTGPVWVDDSRKPLRVRDARRYLTPEIVGTVAERARSVFRRPPRSSARLPALFEAAAAEDKAVLAILADPADPATAAMWESFAEHDAARTAAGRFVTIYRPIGGFVGADPRSAWDWAKTANVAPQTPGPILAVLTPTKDEGMTSVTATAAVSLAGLSVREAAETAADFLGDGADAE
ncbi:MAG: hypothetical protein AAF907_03550, partial [Planctomycetota bacterium]